MRPDGYIHTRQLDGLFIGPGVSYGHAKEDCEGYCLVLYKTHCSPLDKSNSREQRMDAVVGMGWPGGQLLHDERLMVLYRFAIIKHRTVEQLSDLISAVDSVPGFFGLLDQFEDTLSKKKLTRRLFGCRRVK